MATVAEHIREFIAEYEDVTPAKPRNVKIDSFASIEKAGARARKANPDAPDYRTSPAAFTRSGEVIYLDPRKRLVLTDFDGAGW
ncbi:hypothetical protein G6L68_25485 [Agrobacterium fabrum]|uniref:hypothetical protein n=1 Tax=Agrobacterium fabrum TaxID=1176649 RepID=UPI000EF5B13A|nr:hypothetical protein [Agrobacterium fabrum]AYM66140.1 hypothetical protein At12D13_49880 [Agrobacterium fabrum]NTE63988.1 hypothetical protein [Agrobacterium fabrum]